MSEFVNFTAPDVATEHLIGFKPTIDCYDYYLNMFQDPGFVGCYGVRFNDEEIRNIIGRDIDYWNQYGFGPYVWFDSETKAFVGEGGLNHTVVEGDEEIELTYSLVKDCWGKGLACEIGCFAMEQAFNQLNLEHIVCFTIPTNTQSLRVMNKLGFVFERDFVHANLPHQLFKMKRTLPSK